METKDYGDQMTDTSKGQDFHQVFCIQEKQCGYIKSTKRVLYCVQLFKSWMITDLLQIQNKSSEAI